MKLVTLVASISLCAAAFAEAVLVSADARLKDGSTVKGEFLTKDICGSTLFAPELKLDSGNVKSVAFSGTNGEAKVELSNSDKFAMKVSNASFAIKSLLGDLNIPRESVRSIELHKKRNATASATDGLIFHCTFDDEAELALPKAGPAVKLELGTIVSGKGKTGGALYVKPGVAGAEIKFPVGSLGKEGCIEFWAEMASGKTEFSTGGDPRFFVILDSAFSELGNFEFASNDGSGNSGICGTFLGMHVYSNKGFRYHYMPYSDIFKGEDYNGWHHYAFVWTEGSLAIFIDGKEICRGHGRLNASVLAESEIIMDIPLHRKTGKSYNNKSAFYMDELKIWNYAKSEF